MRLYLKDDNLQFINFESEKAKGYLNRKDENNFRLFAKGLIHVLDDLVYTPGITNSGDEVFHPLKVADSNFCIYVFDNGDVDLCILDGYSVYDKDEYYSNFKHEDGIFSFKAERKNILTTPLIVLSFERIDGKYVLYHVSSNRAEHSTHQPLYKTLLTAMSIGILNQEPNIRYFVKYPSSRLFDKLKLYKEVR